jgi:hypothetical protein
MTKPLRRVQPEVIHLFQEWFAVPPVVLARRKAAPVPWRIECLADEKTTRVAGEETEMFVMRNFGKRERIEPKGSTVGGHGGGDTRLRDLIFRKAEAPAHMRLPGSRAGAMSCLTGIAARKSIDENRPIQIADLVRLT